MVVFLWWCFCGVLVVVFESSQHIVPVIRTKVQSIKVVTNHSIGTCSVDLYMLYLFETSGTASCGTTGISQLVQDFLHRPYVDITSMQLDLSLRVGPKLG